MFDNKFFGNRIRELRQSYNFSLKDVADAIGVQKSTIGNIERGDKSPSIDMMLNLADYFYISLDYLLGRSNDSRPEGYLANIEDVMLQQIGFNYLPDFYKNYECRKKNYSTETRIKILFILREILIDHNLSIAQYKDMRDSLKPTIINELSKRGRYQLEKWGIVEPVRYIVDENERTKIFKRNQELSELLNSGNPNIADENTKDFRHTT